MPVEPPSADDPDMNHPIMLLGPGGFVAFSRRARWTILITSLTLLVLLGVTDAGPDRVDRFPTREPAATTVSATIVTAPACEPDRAGCRS
jgi:hypothetical protein